MRHGSKGAGFEGLARRTCGIVLAGGLGERIRHLTGGVPKPLVEVAGRPFIEWVLARLASTGVRQFVISLGYRAEAALRYFDRRPADGLKLVTVCERSPLGTAGAIRYASAACPAEWYLVSNGDSIVIGELSGAWQLAAPERVDGVVVGVEVPDTARFGSLVVDSSGRLRAFAEKVPGKGVINAGVYLLRRRLIDTINGEVPLSLERDVFPRWLSDDLYIAVLRVQADFLDIGTPDALAQAESFIRAHFSWKVSA